MSLQKVTKNQDNTAVLEFSIPKADFDAAVDRVYHKKAPRVSIPGFRKGKAPRSIIEKMYGKGFFYEDALNDLLPEVLEDAVKEAKIDVVSRPELDLEEIGEDGVKGTAKYYTKPELTIKDYKGIKATRYLRKVTAKDVDEAIERTRERNAREIEVSDREARLGDTAVIDYKGTLNGVAFEGGTDEGHHLKLGSGQFIPGFEDQIVGHKPGDEFDVNVTFPKEYHAKDLAGKEAVFAVKLHTLEQTELPELDDEFAKDVSEFDTLKEYKADVKHKLEHQNEHAAQDALDAELTDALVAKVEEEIPQCMYDTECENMLRDYEYNMSQQGISLEMYLKYTGQTIENLKAELAPRAERQVKTRLALEAIAKAEKIAPSADEIDAEYKRLAELYGMEVEKCRELLNEEVLKEDLAMKSAFDFVRNSAVIEDKPFEELEKKTEAEKKAPAKKAPAKKAPAKKPAAKKTADKAE